jgi:hypothetical protein
MAHPFHGERFFADYITVDLACVFRYDSCVEEESSRKMDWILIILIGIFTVAMAVYVILAWKTYK